MESEIQEKYIKAGKIARQVRDYACELVKPGAFLVDIAQNAEQRVRMLGGEIAFPINISINDTAAHFHPEKDDQTCVKDEDYVKIDVGVHVDGYIGDTAKTIRVAGKDDLIVCSEKMLETALAMAKPGTTIGEMGSAIESVADEFGFKSVRNLTGHSLGKFDVHAGLIVPNIRNDSQYQLREDEVIAIEPFCTTGTGAVKDSGKPLILRWIVDRPTRLVEARRILEMARNDFQRLPFAKRWVQEKFSKLKVELSLRELLASNALYGYAPLKEVSGKPVAQTEHTVIVKEKPIITTC
ncbi:MAG: type II methionyl aminopeptidase [Candidatus Aenigmarchaeota archaeon]|nr:type II methionyl aminopeptidase [Candidatus Aenigmarchaeota archaeon]